MAQSNEERVPILDEDAADNENTDDDLPFWVPSPKRHHSNFDMLPWRTKLGVYLESHAVEMCIVVLVFMDIICVIFEILEQIGWLQHKDSVENFVSVTIWTSRTILILFSIEIALKVVAWGKTFLKKKWHIFDMVVVSVCIILEIIDSTVHSSEHVQSVIDDDHTHAGASHEPEHEHDHLLTSVLLLYMSVIIFRMLRIVHVIHDLYAVAKKMHEEKWEDTLHQKVVEIAQLKAKLGMKPECRR